MPDLRMNATLLARQLVMNHGRNATAYQILNPGIARWLNGREDAVVGYVRRGSWLLVAGEPVCAPATLPEAIREFEAFARRDKRRVCYVCADESMRDLLAESGGHSAVTIGAQPVWRPADWMCAGGRGVRCDFRSTVRLTSVSKLRRRFLPASPITRKYAGRSPNGCAAAGSRPCIFSSNRKCFPA